MESKNHKIIKNFISDNEADQIRKWIEIDGLSPEPANTNHHLTEIAKSINGISMIFDISDTNITEYISKFQSVHKVKTVVPDFIKDIVDRVAEFNRLPKDHIFLQVIDMKKGGKIKPHYDASISGYINYKCNISVFSEDYDIFIGDTSVKIEEKDLYCFEASLYRHWTNEFNSRRIFLSIGFIVPYSVLNRTENDPRVRLSKRIEKYFQRL